MPGYNGGYHVQSTKAPSDSTTVHVSNNSVSLAQNGNIYRQPNPPDFNMYPQSSDQTSMPPPIQDSSVMNSMNNPQSGVSPPYSQNSQNINQQSVTINTLPNSMPQPPQNTASQIQDFSAPLFDPNDPALFKFDIASLNFGNHYGALEFGMLGHMSSGAAETPPSDSNPTNPLSQTPGMFSPSGSSTVGYSDATGLGRNYTFGSDGMSQPDWQSGHSRNSSIIQPQTPQGTPLSASLDNIQANGQHGFSTAYAIGAGGPSSFSSTSPSSNAQDIMAGFENPPTDPAFFASTNLQQTAQQQRQTAIQLPARLSSVRRLYRRKILTVQKAADSKSSSINPPFFHLLQRTSLTG